MSWAVDHYRGSARSFHERTVPSGTPRSVWVHDVVHPAVVLGSAQGDDVLDDGAVAATGVEVVRRRSGGGVVLLVPSEVLWIDVVIGRDDPLWDDDVARAMWWLGERFASVLGEDATVHRGRMVTTSWSRLVCFAGLGPGEVTVDGRKAVGISQRRTRDTARFQCALHRRWDIGRLAGLLRVDDGERERLVSELGDAVAVSDLDTEAVVDAIVG